MQQPKKNSLIIKKINARLKKAVKSKKPKTEWGMTFSEYSFQIKFQKSSCLLYQVHIFNGGDY